MSRHQLPNHIANDRLDKRLSEISTGGRMGRTEAVFGLTEINNQQLRALPKGKGVRQETTNLTVSSVHGDGARRAHIPKGHHTINQALNDARVHVVDHSRGVLHNAQE
jgi:hypothetical protein